MEAALAFKKVFAAQTVVRARRPFFSIHGYYPPSMPFRVCRELVETPSAAFLVHFGAINGNTASRHAEML